MRRAWQSTPVFLPGESPWTEEPGGLQTMGLQRVDMTESTWIPLFSAACLLWSVKSTIQLTCFFD